jgi:hypothetical protein
MSDQKPIHEEILVIVYCTRCGYRLLEGVHTGEPQAGTLRISRTSIETLRRSGTCRFCDAPMDAKQLPDA